MLFFNLLKIKKWLSHMSLLLFLSCISLEQYCQKSHAESGEFGKNIKRGDYHIEGGGGGVYSMGASNLLHTDIERLNGGALES